MKRCITAVLGLVAMLMMVMPSVASAGVVWVPERVDRWWCKRLSCRLSCLRRLKPLLTIGRGHAPIRTIATIIFGDAVNRRQPFARATR